MNIRAATLDDATTLAGIINRAFAVEKFFKICDRTSPTEIGDLLQAGATFLVAEDAGAIVGCVLVKARGTTGYFGMLSVEPDAQGKGLSRRLIDALEAFLRARGCQQIEIEIVNLRTELPPFYEKFGYAKTGERPYPTPELSSQPCHFVVMTKRLLM
jgi:ribosomal protein S18 acetylase RimI-like enzyme